MSPRVTMKDIAAAAGVSPSTVCRALGLDTRIPAPTRDRIRKIATRLGYRADPLLSAFARRRRGSGRRSDVTTIAYITAYPTADEWERHPFYGPLHRGASAQATHHGYRLEHFWLGEPGMTPDRLGDILYSRGIVALCIAPTPAVRSRLALDWTRFSAVTVGYSLLHPDLHRAAPHHFHAVQTAVRRLWHRGYRHVGFCIFASTSARVDDLWLAAALLVQRLHPEPGLHIHLFDDATLEHLADWARANHLDAVLSDNQFALHALRRGGLQVPGDIDFATLNYTRDEPEIAGIDQAPARIGAAAIELIISQVRRSERGVPDHPTTTLVEGDWIDGPSLLRSHSIAKRSPHSTE